MLNTPRKHHTNEMNINNCADTENVEYGVLLATGLRLTLGNHHTPCEDTETINTINVQLRLQGVQFVQEQQSTKGQNDM
jgi:hypothetical protein